MTGSDPDRVLLDKIDAREKTLTREAEQTRAQIAELTAKLGELDEAIDHLRIIRKSERHRAHVISPWPMRRARLCRVG